MYRFLKAMVREEELARDLAQDTFVRAFQALGSFRGSAQLTTWTLAIARNVALNRIRRRRLEDRWHVAVDALPDAPDDRPAPGPANSALLAALAGLPQAQREAVELFYVEDLEIDEVARLTGRPVNTIKSDLHRARSRLRAALDSAEAAPPDTAREEQ